MNPKKAILICPGERQPVAFLGEFGPLVNLPVCGETVLEHWLRHLSELRGREVLVLVTDRPQKVMDSIGSGARWGLKVEVKRELQELTVEEGLMKHGDRADGGGGSRAVVVDHLPGLEAYPLFLSYGHWFSGIRARLGKVGEAPPVGSREVAGGIWVGPRTRVSASAILHAPCWLGEDVHIGANSVIGPEAVVESRVVVENSAEISYSFVGPETFVGTLTRIKGSVAWGSLLINWGTGSCLHVPDGFLLSALGPVEGSGFWLGLKRWLQRVMGRR